MEPRPPARSPPTASSTAAGTAGCTFWQRPHELIWEIRDPGRIAPGSLLAMEPQASAAERGRGLWLARELSDDLHVWCDADGTGVRGTMGCSMGTFAVGTDAFVIAGVLPSIAETLRVSIGAAGQLVTVFSLAYALAAPVIGVPDHTLVTPPRR